MPIVFNIFEWVKGWSASMLMGGDGDKPYSISDSACLRRAMAHKSRLGQWEDFSFLLSSSGKEQSPRGNCTETV